MNTTEKNAVIAASIAIDGVTPDGVILIRTRESADHVGMDVKWFGVRHYDIIKISIEMLAYAAMEAKDDDIIEDRKELIVRLLSEAIKVKLSTGAVKG